MKRIICLTSAPPFAEAAPGQEPVVPGMEIRTLRGAAASGAWPTADSAAVEVMFCSTPPPNLDAFPNLKWLQIESAGFSHLFPFKLAERGVTVTNARGLFDCPIAEWNVAMMINLVRDLRTMVRNQEHGVWDRSPKYSGEVRTRTLGIWGYGGIGRETARLAKALGMRVHVLTRSGKKSRSDCTAPAGLGDPEGSLPDRYFGDTERAEFLQGLDFLVVAMPLTGATEGLIGEAELRKLPKGAFLLNPARGPIIRQEALLAVLRDGHLGGAALDTHYQYPMPADHPLWAFPNVFMTPHISGTTFSPNFRRGLQDIFLQNAVRYLAEEPLLNVIPPEDLR